MPIDLLAIEPHKVSTDLSGYVTYIYGQSKAGKTTFASKMPGCLLLAFEKGYSAIPGVIAQDIHTWGEFKQVVRELKKPEVHEKFQSIAIDTYDIAVNLCEKYICQREGVNNISDLAYGKGTRMVKNEIEETFRTIVQLNYALFIIAHDRDRTFKTQTGEEYNQIVPSISPSYNEVAANMADIYAYAHPAVLEDGTTTIMLTLRSLDNSVATGCRFKYIENEIPFNYNALSKALVKAIEKESEEYEGKYITAEKAVTLPEDDNSPTFDELKASFGGLVSTLQERTTNIEFNDKWAPLIQEIVSKNLGKGRTVASMDETQKDILQSIVDELTEVVNSMS